MPYPDEDFKDDHTPVGFLITFRCFGTWLHGDRRGSVDRFHNVYGTPKLGPERARVKYERKLMTQPPVRLSAKRRAAAEQGVKDACKKRGWQLWVVNARTNRVHSVVTANCNSKKVRSTLKAYATKAMREAGCWLSEESAWSYRGSRISLWTEEETLLHEAPDELRNLIRGGIEREMTRIQNMDFGLRHVAAIGLRFRKLERQVVSAPKDEKARLLLAHPSLPLGVGVDVCAVVVKEVALNVGLAGLIEKGKFIGPEIRVIAFHVRIVSDMARPRRRQRQEICAKGAFVGSAIGPKGPPRLPIRPQAFVVRHSVLDDESLDPVRLGQGHSKTNRAPVILHVKRVAREPERFGKMIHDVGIVIERICEFFRVRPVAVSEGRVIRRDKVVAIGKPGEERLEHPR